MEIWHIWIIVGLAFIILEIFTPGFAVACFSIGAAVSAILSACGCTFIWQLVGFVTATALALIFVRPVLVKMISHKDKTTTNADAIIGRKCRVCQTIDPVSGKGRVAIDGDEWKAVSNDGSLIEKGETVEVIGRDSLIITVKKS